MSAPAISCVGLKKHYGDVKAVDGLDLEVAPGECFGLLGPNGAGKTTTIEILEGLTVPDSGEVTVLGRRWGSHERELRERLGVSLQESRLTEKLTVFRDNPTMRISIVGFASQPGTSEYNMALGLRRAEAAKAYLVSQGIAQSRIEIATRGEGQLVVEGPGEAADAQNRRGQFSLLIADQP